MRKTRSIRFNTIVDVFKDVPVPLVDKEESDMIELATEKEDSIVIEPPVHEEQSHVPEPEVVEEETDMSEATMDEEETDMSEATMDEEETDMSEATMDEEESDVTEPAMDTESYLTESAFYTERYLAESAFYTERYLTESAFYAESHVTEPAVYTDSHVTHVTEPVMETDSHETEPPKDTDSRVTKPAIARGRSGTETTIVLIDNRPTEPERKTEEDYMNEMALDIAENAITAAINIVEEDDQYTIKNIDWLTHGEFTPEKCRKQIHDFVSTWEYDDRWVHYTKLVETRDLIHSFHYIYSVRWSVPTSQVPTAYSSAFAFFTIKFNKNKPPDAPLDISYMFEGQSLVHRPGTTRFREYWVKEMVLAKHNIMKSFPF